VANVVDGVLRACHAPGIGGEMMNVATGGRISLNELLAPLSNLVGTRTEAVYAEPRAGDVRDSQADIGRARRLTGYEPTVGLREGLERTLAWYRSEQPPL
jgi:nucleoside-diphosphate-sugar epimerase